MSENATPEPERGPRRTRLILGVVAGLAVVAVGGFAIFGTGSPAPVSRSQSSPSASAPAKPARTVAATGSAAPAAPGAPSPTPAAGPATFGPVPPDRPGIAAKADRETARGVLAASVAHYQQLFDQGQSIVGTTRYADDNAVKAALGDPASAAARLRDWRKSPNPEGDVGYQAAFTQAQSHFTPANEPQMVTDWLHDMATMTAFLTKWVQTAASYQGGHATQADLDAAAAGVRQGLVQVGNDARNVGNG